MRKEKRSSLFAETMSRIWSNPGAKVGIIILVIIVSACIFAPFIASYGLNEMDLKNMFKGPSAKHIMGTDGMGRDLFSRLLYGGRYSLALGICAAVVGSVIGIIIGSVAGYLGGQAETIIMRFMDIWSSLPSMLLCILISAVLGAGFFNTVLALSIGNVPIGVRLIRGQILSERSKEYLEAAESINCSKISIMFRHLLPNVISPVIVDATMGIGMTITMAAALSYIGLGVQPPTPEWGAMLADARTHILNYPYLIMFPGLFIALTVLAINLIGDGLRDAMDPKLRK
ncbi:peptide/nickel transport system permease protein [Kineothrix alysoides]|uniref:Peptide/nickel transport system permease protein n=1 Tax=Kineothrix alysoides TaxID=1469948 RepID=A0A4R1R6W8_9FIRM|nr:ABC transporter permease [Kineothrix alysoides]TCL61260.1 peptide/nickel transport system permease protein [Kineothrix alysoides]